MGFDVHGIYSIEPYETRYLDAIDGDGTIKVLMYDSYGDDTNIPKWVVPQLKIDGKEVFPAWSIEGYHNRFKDSKEGIFFGAWDDVAFWYTLIFVLDLRFRKSFQIGMKNFHPTEVYSGITFYVYELLL